MLKYILYRLLLFIPMLLVISLLAFFITLQEPRDPIDMIIIPPQAELNMEAGQPELFPKDYLRKKQAKMKELHLDRPLFYFSLTNLATPDTLYKIPNKETRQALHQILFRSGNWKAVEAYHESLKELLSAHEVVAQTLKEKLKTEVGRNLLYKEIKPESTVSSDNKDSNLKLEKEMRSPKTASFDYQDTVTSDQMVNSLHFEINNMLSQSLRTVQNLPKNGDHKLIDIRHTELQELYQADPFLDTLKVPLQKVISTYQAIERKKTLWKLYVPYINPNGWNTQYHHWLIGVITKLDFGYTFDRTGDKVMTRIYKKIPYSLLFAVISSIIIYAISIPLGVWTAYKKGTRWDRWTRNSLFALDAIPNFWMAYLLLLFFANPDIVGTKFTLPVQFDLYKFSSYILPLIAYVYGGLAFLSRQVRINVLSVSQEEYILAARARGIPEKTLWRKHILKNALLPLITIFGTLFPALVGGSVILESIFTIHGMGEYIISVMNTKDLPSIVAVFTLLGVMTMIGYLISDILYHVVDPRIRLGRA